MKKILLFSAFVLLSAFSAQAEFSTEAKQAVLIDYATGSVLFEKNADERMVPSSMSKMMTLYVVFDKLKSGEIKLEDTMPVSEKAWRTGGSKMFVELGNRIKVDDLIKGVAVQSGNDACVVLAEGIAGSEEAFADVMNAEAKKIGMEGTHFVNSNGWPDPEHYSTARDLALLSAALVRDFPDHYPLFAITEFTYHGILQHNRNPLLGEMGVDGIKTGHTEEGGFGIAMSAVQNGRRLVLVVNGLKSQKERESESGRLLRYGFTNFVTKTVASKGQKVGEARVWMGGASNVSLLLDDDASVSMPKTSKDKLSMTLEYNDQQQAPIKKGDRMGQVLVQMPGTAPKIVPVVAGEDVEALSGLSRLWPAIKYYLFMKE